MKMNIFTYMYKRICRDQIGPDTVFLSFIGQIR